MIKNKKVVSEVLPWLALAAFIGIFTLSLTPNFDKTYRYAGIFLSGIIPIGFYHYALIQRSEEHTV